MTVWQLFWLETIAGMGFYFVTIPRTLVVLMQSGAWLAPLGAIVLLAPFLFWLVRRIPWGSSIKLGPGLALVILGLTMIEGAVTLRRYGEFINTAIMPETPILVIVILTLILPVVLARGGLKLIVRFNFLLTPIFILATVIVFMLSAPDFDPFRLKPLFFIEFSAFIKAVIFMMGFTLNMLPLWFLSEYFKIKKEYEHWLIWAGMLMPALLISLTCTLVVGIFGLYTVQRLFWPMLDVVKNISLGGFIERIEVAFLMLWFQNAVIRLALLLYIGAWAVGRLFQLKNDRMLVWPLAFWQLGLAMLPTDAVQAVLKIDTVHFWLILLLSPWLCWWLASPKLNSKRILSLLIIFMMLINQGCWNRKEAEKIQYALAVGVDRAPDGKVLITVQMPLLEKLKAEKGAEGHKSWTIISNGETTFEAVRHLIMATGAKLFFSHMQVLVIGEDAAREGVDQIIDFFSSDHELRGTPYVLVARGKAYQVLQNAPPYTPLPATFLKDQVEKVASGTSGTVKVKMGDFLAALASQGAQAPLATAVEPLSWQKYSREVLGLEVEQRGELLPERVLYMAGAAFLKGTRLAGWLDARETRGVLWVKGKVQSGIIVAPQPGGGKISFEIIRIEKRRLKPGWRNGKPYYQLELEVEGNLGEKSGFTNPATGPNVKQLEQHLTRMILQEIQLAWKKQRQTRADIFGLGAALAAEKPEIWEKVKERWSEVMPTAHLELKIKVRVRRLSTTIYSPWAKGK